MEKPEKVIRKYNKSDVLLLEQSQTMLDNFIEDIAEFTPKYPGMDATYATAWQTAINDADDAPDDEEVLGDQKQKTLAVTDTMRLAQNKYSALVTYLKMIYKDDQKAVLDHFGSSRYRKDRNKQLKLKELMDLAYERANSATYKAALIAKGFLQTDIDELNTLAQQLLSFNQQQEKSKTDRPEIRQDRVTLHNNAWNIMTEVNIAASVVFINDYARQQHYLLYPEKSNGETPLQTIQSIIGMGSFKNEGPLIAGAQTMNMLVLVGGPIEFGLSVDGMTFSGNTITVGAAGQSNSVPISYFASAGNIILVRNQNGAANGEYKIEILG